MSKTQELREITPDLILEAYRKIGAEPVQGKWFDQSNTNCMCGLMALCVFEGVEKFKNQYDGVHYFVHRTELVDELLAKGYKVSFDFVAGFIDGFDGFTKLKSEGDYEEGWLVGRATLYKVFPAYEKKFTVSEMG